MVHIALPYAGNYMLMLEQIHILLIYAESHLNLFHSCQNNFNISITLTNKFSNSLYIKHENKKEIMICYRDNSKDYMYYCHRKRILDKQFVDLKIPI